MATNADQEITAELPSLAVAEQSFTLDAGALMAIDIAAATHEGHVRKNNEDHYLVMRFRRSLENLYTNIDPTILRATYDLTGYGLLVADGLGGMSAGEIASRTALTKLIQLVVETPDWMMSLEQRDEVQTVLERMNERFLRVDETLKQHADRDTSLSGMGTTLTAVATLGDNVVIGHVGDSRAYVFRELIDAGLSRGDPAARSMRHVLTAALGSLGPRTQPEVRQLRLRDGDQLLLCTDGLTEMVDDKTLASLLRNADSAARACEDLITVALAAGGSDNVTVVLARFNSSQTN